jgi:hypothetical protein
MLYGVIQHDLYHAGQIALLKEWWLNSRRKRLPAGGLIGRGRRDMPLLFCWNSHNVLVEIAYAITYRLRERTLGETKAPVAELLKKTHNLS